MPASPVATRNSRAPRAENRAPVASRGDVHFVASKIVERTRSTACATPKLHSGCDRHYRLVPIRRAIREERQRVRHALANLRGSVSCTQKTTNQARAIEAAHLATD